MNDMKREKKTKHIAKSTFRSKQHRNSIFRMTQLIEHEME